MNEKARIAPGLFIVKIVMSSRNSTAHVTRRKMGRVVKLRGDTDWTAFILS